MEDDKSLLEVKTGVLSTFEGESYEVHGGVYLAPEEYLRLNGELQRLRERTVETSLALPVVAIGAALLGVAAGYWLGARGDGDD
ncbi:MAG TPA: hypothetical protein VGD87_11905 [Archangium sp.]